MTTPNSSSPSPPASTTAPDLTKKYSRDRLFYLVDKARATAGLLTPTETLELVDIAEHYRNCFLDAYDEVKALTWDLEHPTNKDR